MCRRWRRQTHGSHLEWLFVRNSEETGIKTVVAHMLQDTITCSHPLCCGLVKPVSTSNHVTAAGLMCKCNGNVSTGSLPIAMN